MDWLAAYEIDTDERAWHLGEPATLTVIMRNLDTDARSHTFLPVEPTSPGEAQREVIARAMAARFPEARSKTYNADKQVASFVGSKHLYLVIYEAHESACASASSEERPTLFAA
jgi:hypothetical protein